MFCPTCGENIDNFIEYNGDRLCPKCGCFIEHIEKEVVPSQNPKKKKINKILPAKIFAVLGIIICLWYLFIRIKRFVAGSLDMSSNFVLYFLYYILVVVSFALIIINPKFHKVKAELVQKCLLICILIIRFITPVENFYYNFTFNRGDFSSLTYYNMIYNAIFIVMIILTVCCVIFNKKIFGIISMIISGILCVCECALFFGITSIISSVFNISIIFVPCLYTFYINDIKKENDS